LAAEITETITIVTNGTVFTDRFTTTIVANDNEPCPALMLVPIEEVAAVEVAVQGVEKISHQRPLIW
jgi:hypothetical protein